MSEGLWNSRRQACIQSLEPRRLLASNVFVGDLPQVNPSNGWGPIEKDHSNGESAAGDGHTITLNGTAYPKGLGVHANSEVDFDFAAGSGYTSFQSDVGVDDEVGDGGSVVFQVWLDSDKVFDSGVMTGVSATQSINIPLANVTARLRLVVTDGGNGKDFDHADWANARFVSDRAPSVPVAVNQFGNQSIAENGGLAHFNFERRGAHAAALPVNFSVSGTATRGVDYVLRAGDATGPILAGNSIVIPAGSGAATVTAVSVDDSILDPNESIILTVTPGPGYGLDGPDFATTSIRDDDQSAGLAYLSELPAISVTNGWGPMELNRSNGETTASDGRTLMLNGQSYVKGLGVHANSAVTYNLDGNFQTFTATLGVDDEVGNNGSVIFQIFADNEKVYDSGIRTGSQPGLPISVDINHARRLKLVVTDAGNGNAFDHADWADAKVIVGASPDFELGLADRSMLTESEGGAERFIISVLAVGENYSPLSFDYETFDMTAVAGKDYVATSGHIDVPAGTMFITYNIYVPTIVDSLIEPSESFGLRFKNVVGSARISDETGTLGIFGGLARLSALNPVSQTNGWGPVEKDQSNGEMAANDGHPISVNGSLGSGGLGVHANSDITYNLADLNATDFSTFVGVDDEVGDEGSVVFQVYVDGQMRFNSGLMTGSDNAKQVDVDVTGALTLRLVVTDGGDGNAFDHADWGGALLQ